MGGAWSRRLAGASLGLVAAAAGSASASAGLTTRACRKDSGERCARLAVPLDRSGALPGTISLRVRILPPLAGTGGETIVALAGGPGQAGAGLLNDFVFALGSRTLRNRRLVAFDQRGTGRSGRLRCPELAQIPNDELGAGDVVQRAVAACAARLGPARAHYATADTVADVEALRAALGVEQIVLYGTSYGTKVALDYAAAHPDHVSRLILDSVVPPGGTDPFQRTTIGSIPRVLRALCARGACPFAPDPGGELAALVRRLGRGPLRGERVDGRGHRRRASVERSDVFSLLLESDLDPFQRALLPGAVHGAVRGDAALLLRLANLSAGSLEDEGGDSDALYLATTCADGGVPWAPGTPIADRASAVEAALAAIPLAQLAPFGADGVRELGFADLCRAWPEAPVAQPYGPLPDVPALILSGDLDLRTPRADALALAAQLPRARVVTVPQTGHSTLSSSLCAENAVAAFLAGRSIRSCRFDRRDRAGRPVSPPPRRLAEVRGLPGLPPRVGRTLVAVIETFELTGYLLLPDLTASPDDDALRIGGLRGGSLTITARRIVLRDYSVVPGVALDARIEAPGRTQGEAEDDEPIVMHVGGRAAAHGVLRVGERWTVGRLDGQRIRRRTRVLDRTARAHAADAAKVAEYARRNDTPLPAVSPALRRLLGWS